jgi:CHAT domain-containing protein
VLRLSAFPGSSRTFCLNSSFTESIDEIDFCITNLRHDLSILPRSDSCHHTFLLAWLQFRRYDFSNQREDLDNAIVQFTKSILQPLCSWLKRGPIILQALYYLASALSARADLSEQPEDAIYATKYLFFLRDLPHPIIDIPHYKVTKLLVGALLSQMELKAGNVMQNIREIAVLSRELFNLNTFESSDVDTAGLISLIHGVVSSNIDFGVSDQPVDELIECLRAARKHRPDLLEGSFALAISLITRYDMTYVNDDYEEAASILDEIIADTSLGNPQDKSLAEAQGRATGLVTGLAMMRSNAYGTPEYLEEAIYRTRTCVSSSSHKEHFPSVIYDPEATSKERSRYFGPIEGGEESSGNWLSLAEPTIRMLEYNKMEDLLFGIRNNDDTKEIEEAIEKGRSILPSDPGESILDSFGDILKEAFKCTKKIEYLNESIGIRRQLMETPLPQSTQFRIIRSLSHSLLSRFQFFPDYCTQDLNEGLELLSRYVSSAHASLPDRFMLACARATFARRYDRHSYVSTAYEIAMSLMQDTPLFSPTLQLQHVTLVTHDDVTQGLSLDYASYQVEQHQIEEAIEILERGRALLWSEMRHLRASVDQLLEVDPDLAHKFTAINRDLEELTKSVPPSHKLSMDDAAPDGLRAVDPFGRLLLKQRGLLEERAKLISQIQNLPGFESFLASPSFDALRSAASSGPVVIINHSSWRSDILILFHDKSPSLITTPNDFYDRAGALKDKLLESRRKYGLDSSDYEKTLANVLGELYKLVGKPVIDRLRQLQIPEQSRIWWYPTSVFCSLPLHAMGPIPSDDGEMRYFLDLYICSYTPTLSGLIQSRHRDSSVRSSDRPSLLLIAQPNSLPTVEGEIQVIQALETKVTSLISEAATPATAIDGFNHHGFVHFSCHGELEAGKPFEAGFKLHGGERLTLLDIVRAHIPDAEFAFLSACHTAEMTEGSNEDVGLHLAAAVQYCGFRSVVGTMWAMVDEDGCDLAKHFYKVLFSNSRRDQGLPYHERSAKALQSAVKRLRRRRITLERWVNFVHYGA